MKYLFFDIECSNCFEGVGKMCEFGYVITDENFNLISKDVIPMSPGRGGKYKFDKSIYKRDPEFQWAYDFDYYYECEEYPTFHNKIKRLFEDNETLVLGHSVENDIRYLDSTIKRYNLDSILYTSYDTQKMIGYYSEKHEKFMGLKDAFKKLCGTKELVFLEPHLSRDDAFMTMRVVQEMCKHLGFTLQELIEACPECKIDTVHYLEQYYIKKSEKKYKTKKKCDEAQIAWRDFYRSHSQLLENEDSVGKIVTISSRIKESLETTNSVIEKIKEYGLVAFDKINGSNYLIALDDNDVERMKSIFKHPFNGRFILLSDFIDHGIKVEV